jgi:hypothetical protein
MAGIPNRLAFFPISTIGIFYQVMESTAKHARYPDRGLGLRENG